MTKRTTEHSWMCFRGGPPADSSYEEPRCIKKVETP